MPNSQAWEAEETLLHCQSGISRSATVAIAFLMKHRGMSLMDAYAEVHRRRSCINPNDGFFRVLQAYAVDECGYAVDEAGRVKDTNEYNAYQLVAQLAFTNVTLSQAREALAATDGGVEAAASALLEAAGM